MFGRTGQASGLMPVQIPSLRAASGVAPRRVAAARGAEVGWEERGAVEAEAAVDGRQHFAAADGEPRAGRAERGAVEAEAGPASRARTDIYGQTDSSSVHIAELSQGDPGPLSGGDLGPPGCLGARCVTAPKL